jgi:hypothetical protein
MSELSLKLDKQVIDNVIAETVKTQIALALNGHGEALIAQIVAQVLNQKVDGEGKPDRYNDSRAETFLMHHVGVALRAAVRDAIKEWVTTQQKAVKSAVAAAMKKDAGPFIERLLVSITEGLGDAKIVFGSRRE